MLALLQRVRRAAVEVDGKTIGKIEQGLLIFLCAEKNDTPADVEVFIERLLNYRVCADAQGKTNLSVRSSGGGVLLVPQFTLAADTRSGLRPGFSDAAPPALARELFSHAWQYLQAQHPHTACGEFGADMQVHLINDGPATYWMQSR